MVRMSLPLCTHVLAVLINVALAPTLQCDLRGCEVLGSPFTACNAFSSQTVRWRPHAFMLLNAPG
eukprot:3352884-Lingulodinium_polyedra.AAC.1